MTVLVRLNEMQWVSKPVPSGGRGQHPGLRVSGAKLRGQQFAGKSGGEGRAMHRPPAELDPQQSVRKMKRSIQSHRALLQPPISFCVSPVN